VLELGEADEHIMITGPNGSGKSTLTFCLGAVLASPKVDLEGLRSMNLPEGHTWHAEIEVIFRNAGNHRVDAPEFIAFRLRLEQPPGEAVKKEYWILEGDRPGEWKKENRYAVSERSQSITEYRQQLQHKYKVAPDSFYLIWYQQDVNQFAVMRPEERFRIFSEMTGLDQTQQTWEKVKEELKEAQDSEKQANSHYHGYQIQLGNYRDSRNKLLERNERRSDSLKKSIAASDALRRHALNRMMQLKERIDELDEQKDEAYLYRAETESEYERYEHEKAKKAHLKAELEHELDAVEAKIRDEEQERDELEHIREALEDRLQELSAQIERIPYEEAIVRQELTDSKQGLEANEEQLNRSIADGVQLQAQLDDVLKEMGRLEGVIERESADAKNMERILAQHGSVRSLEDEHKRLEDRRMNLMDREHRLHIQFEQYKDEEQRLTREGGVSYRQERSIRALQNQNLVVYTMRDLLEMDPNLPLERERKLESIKYTLFIDSRTFTPSTDLYHVELPALVPDSIQTELSELGLRIREGLNNQMYAAAQKALFWVNGMTIGPLAKLQDRVLIDAAGRRGRQEEESWVLSERGIRLKIASLQTEQQKITQERNEIEDEKKQIASRLGSISSALPEVRAAEAFQLRQAERERHLQEFANMQKQQNTDLQKRKQLDEQSNELRAENAKLNYSLELYTGYVLIYDEWAGQKEEVQRMQATRLRLDALKRSLNEYDRKRESWISDLERCEKEQDNIERRIREKKQWLAQNAEDLERIGQSTLESVQRLDVEEQKVAGEQQYIQTWSERLPVVLEEIEQQTPDFCTEVELNEEQANAQKTKADSELNFACSMTVDENAIENYEKFKHEYEKAEQDLQNARGLLMNVGNKLAEAEENMIRSTNYEVKQVGDRFQRFMDQFGFDGEVSWDHIAKSERVTYLLNIKARKQGHRGPLTEVNIKGRGGKVGRGVSGGEESLSSLLFALALLKTIQAEPGYIVLDEFDSALDESRKSRVFQLYQSELARKMLILSPKSHQSEYLNHFSRTFVIYHDPDGPKSDVFWIRNKEEHTTG